MFNGIIYDQGIIKNIKKNPRYVLGSSVIEIKSNIKLKKSDIGESVSCDGVCLTLIGIKNKNSFFFYLSKETLKRSNFKNVIIGKSVNMEKSLYFGKKISGHYTQGHVDTTAKIKDIKIIEKSWVIDLKIPNKFQKYLVEEASISVNGVSLTISKITKTGIQITIIPHTLKLTNLIKLKPNYLVNIEFDIFGKYLLKLKN